MLFTDSAFLLRFLPLLLGLFFVAVAATPRRWRRGSRHFTLPNLVLLVGCALFLARGAGQFFRWIAGAALFTYLVALGIGWARRREVSSGRAGPLPEALLTLGVAGNVVLLVVFKFALALPANLADRVFAVPQLLAPLGLTFFACHAISYVVDVTRGEAQPQSNPVNAALYLLFFPVLCAGPLVRYRDMGPQLAERRVTLAAFAYGVRRWLVGLCKVVLLARLLAGPADAAFALPASELGVLQAWLGAVCFALQVYFDLSGYADMAIGFGRMFGFRLFENFRGPYAATTLTEFWTRWNVSLLDWGRAYLGLSLRAERAGAPRAVRARDLMLLLLFVGLWHGPGWHVVAWGVGHGALVALEQTGFDRRLARLPVALRHGYLLLVVLCLWVLFRADSLTGAGIVLQGMIGWGGPGAGSPTLTLAEGSALVFGALAVMPMWSGFGRWVVTVDALTTSIIILVSTSFVFVWRRLATTVRFLAGRRR